MLSIFDPLREFTFFSVFLRLALAMVFGGVIGLERAKKRRPAGFRTYMFVCMGAALTILIGQYSHLMLQTRWLASAQGLQTDAARIGAQVINGIGFLGAGTIIVTSRQQVKGLTTAAGLWASACMGLAIGAGFYECVLLAFLLITLCIRLLPALEAAIMERARDINIYVEFASLDDVGAIIARIKEQDVQVYSVDISRPQETGGRNPSAVFSLHLNRRSSHEDVLAAIFALDQVLIVDEI